MSHLSERKEKNCLNCGARVVGKYCHECGQENTEPRESVWHLASHYLQDITHFDGKFFSTLKQLIVHPGFLSAEYVRGKRSSYLNPIRMYVFTSAFFFLIYFSFVRKEAVSESGTSNSAAKVLAKLQSARAEMEASLKGQKDTSLTKNWQIQIGKIDQLISQVDAKPYTADSLKETIDNSSVHIGAAVRSFASNEEYDSIQLTLPAARRDNWFAKKIQYRIIAAKQKYGGDNIKIQEAVIHKFTHSFPQLLFLSLPFFALILKLLYFRHKEFFYVDHVIFTIHLYCASFILMLLIFGVSGVVQLLSWQWLFYWVIIPLWVGMLFYQYKSLKNFYRQKRFKTILKQAVLNFSMFIVIVLLAVIILLFSVYQI